VRIDHLTRFAFHISAEPSEREARRSGHPTRYRRALHSADPFIVTTFADTSPREARRNAASTRADEPPVDNTSEFRREGCLHRAGEYLTVYHRDVTRELASARISRRRAPDACTFTCQLSLRGGPTPVFLSVSRANGPARTRERERERERERKREKEREHANTRFREGCPREQGATVRVLPNPGKITA